MSTNTNLPNRPGATRILVYSAICLALAYILSNAIIFRMPQGGSVTLASMFFIALVGYWFGIRAGLAVGLAFGFLRMFHAPQIWHPIQAMLDYVVAYAALGGIAGIFSGRRFGQYGLYIGYLAGVTGTFLSQYASGIIFFSHFAPEGTHIVLWSAIYNLSHNLPEVIITFAILALPSFKHALDSVAPEGSVSSDNGLSRVLQGKAIMQKLPYAIVSAALFISFFVFPLIHRGVRVRSDASGWGIASGSSGLFEGSYSAVFLLLLAPIIMFVLTLMNASVKMLLYSAILGFVVKLGFAIWAAFITSDVGILGPDYNLSMSNVIVLAIFAGLISTLRLQSNGQEQESQAT